MTTDKSSAVAEMSDRGHNRHGPKRGGGAAVRRHGPKRGGCYAPFAGEMDPCLTQRRLGRGLPPYQVAS